MPKPAENTKFHIVENGQGYCKIYNYHTNLIKLLFNTSLDKRENK